MRSMTHIPRFGRAEQVILLVACVVTPLAAEAYVGPGAGLSLLSALWGLLAAVGAAFLFLIMWPIRRMRRRKRDAQAARENPTSVAHGQSPPHNKDQHKDEQDSSRG